MPPNIKCDTTQVMQHSARGAKGIQQDAFVGEYDYNKAEYVERIGFPRCSPPFEVAPATLLPELMCVMGTLDERGIREPVQDRTPDTITCQELLIKLCWETRTVATMI